MLYQCIRALAVDRAVGSIVQHVQLVPTRPPDAETAGETQGDPGAFFGPLR